MNKQQWGSHMKRQHTCAVAVMLGCVFAIHPMQDLELAVSALGQKQTFAAHKLMSALPPKADIERLSRNVC